MSASPPITVIDWWLGKTRQERKAFLEAENTSDNVRANIAAVEAYCLSHPYEVFRDSTLRPRPFAPLLLRPGPAGTLAVPGVAPQEVLSHLPLVCASPLVAVGARYLATPRERREVERASTDHVAGVTRRVAALLQRGETGAQIAQMMVRVLAEAVSAALHRTGAAAAIESHERGRFLMAQEEQQRALSGRVLHLSRSNSTKHAGRTDEGEQQRLARAASGGGLPGEEAGGGGALAMTRPIAACANAAVGLEGLTSSFVAVCGGAAATKRPRDADEEPEGDAGTPQPRNPWTALRLAMAASLPGVEAALAPKAAAPEEERSLLPASIEITGKDMALALLSVARQAEFQSLLPRPPS